ncbi:MAG TPA: alpha/beta fold hydrolase [Thermoleophilaceae bacterium]|nr:alpha/beta fold hydrolase [Thermoleophilaceae bacterium]
MSENDAPPRTPETIETALGPVEVERAGEGPPVLVVHGTPGGSDQGLAMGRFLVDAGFETIAPSRPGYLGTALDDGRAEIDAQADLHAALLGALGHQSAGVLAWSGGGPSAFRLAVRHPERVSALVVAAGVSQRFAPDKASIDEQLMMDTRAGNWLLRFLASHTPKATVSSTLGAEGDLSRKELRELTREAVGDERQAELVLAMARAAADHAHRGAGIDNDLARFAAIESLELERIGVPTLIVSGDGDVDVAPAHSDHAAATIPGAEHVVLSRGTHLALWVHPDVAAAQARAIDLLRR